MKRILLIIILILGLSPLKSWGQQKAYKNINNFSGGELSPLVGAREDLSKYHSGLATMENIIPLPQGPAEKRPGTKYVAGSKNNTNIRLIPFIYSTSPNDSYVIEAGNQYFRFFTDNAAVNRGVGTESLGSIDNIVAHYLMNETVGTSVADDDGATYNGTLKDSADTATDISIVSATGYVGEGCFDLDGLYTVEIADAAAWSFTDNSNDSPFSIFCWANVTYSGGLQVLMSKWRDQSTTREWRFSLSDERKLQLHLTDSSADLSGLRVAQYYLNENAATTHVDDVSTNHDGIATTNTENMDATGKINGAFNFDGQYAVTVIDDDALSFGDGASDSKFSISAWIYVTSGSGNRTILSKYDSVSGLREWWLRMATSEEIRFVIYDQSANAYEEVMSQSLSVGSWHHVVVTYDGRGGASAHDGMEIYVDNVNDTYYRFTSAGTYTAMENTATKMVIGAAYTAAGPALSSYWAYKMDNVILCNVELTTAHISLLWNDGNGTESLTGTVPTPYTVSDDAVSIGWHMLGATYSAPADQTTAASGIILYVDGAAVASTATNDADYTAMQGGAEEVRIGSQRNFGDTANENFWEDKIDELSVFSDVLTPAEVAGLYTTTPYEVTTPYLTADLYELKFEQSADVLTITHPDYEPRKLSRYADTIWTLVESAYETGPFQDENTNETFIITPSAVTGSITLTATGTDFLPFYSGTTAGHMPSGSAATSKSITGALWKFSQPITTGAYKEVLSNNYTADQTENVSWLDCGTIAKDGTWYLLTTGTWTGTLKVQRSYVIGAAHGASSWEDVPGATFISVDDYNVSTNATESVAEADYRCILTTSGDAAEDCDILFRISDDSQYGIVEITGVASPTSATATVLKTLPNTNATHRWSEGSWSNYRGWPRAVTYFEDRLVYGGNANQPDTIWASETGNYDNFHQDTDDDDPLSFTLSSRQVNVIEWLIGKDKLIIGTSGAEWSMEGGADEPLTPSNVIAKQHSSLGSADLQATIANESILFFQRGAEKMRELAYNWELDSYVSPDMTILAEHITGDGITNTSFQKVPNSILWCVRDDGQIAIFVYERKELITSWARIITDGTFESVAVISGGSEDEVWVSVNRSINGSTVRYIEYFAPRYFGTDVDDAYFVDCGITYDSTATTTITGLTHLEAETVAVLGDGAVQTSKTVSSGQITITSASTVQAGLPYTVQLKTLPLSMMAEGAQVLGRVKRINQVIPRYYNSGDFYVGRDTTDKELLSISSMDTSDVDTDDRLTFPVGYDRFGNVLVYQQSPEPLTLIGMLLEFEIQ